MILPAQTPKRRRVLFGRRLGRPLRPGRKRLLRDLLPRLSLSLDGPEAKPATLDPGTLFPVRPARIWLEIGFGAGEHLAAQALAHGDVGFIGCEPFINGVAALLARVEKDGIENIRIHSDDARLLLDHLATASLERVFLLFPDPWPKARHARRRFINGENLDALARVLGDGGELRIASDDRGYQRWALAALVAHPDFEWQAECADDWRCRPADQPATRYEEKARTRGAKPVFLQARRRPRA